MAKTIALRNCKFVGELVEGSALTTGDLLFRDGLIDAIAPCGTVFEGVDEEHDAKGMTALPGLIDAHIHLGMTNELQTESFFLDPCARTMETMK